MNFEPEVPDIRVVPVRKEVTPTPEPSREPFDPHMMPLDNEDDARYLEATDPRRIEIERKRGSHFGSDR
jgi:hypothetical protein